MEESQDVRVVSRRVSEDRIDLQIHQAGRLVADLRIQNDGSVTHAETPDGIRVGSVERLASGDLQVRDSTGRVILVDG